MREGLGKMNSETLKRAADALPEQQRRDQQQPRRPALACRAASSRDLRGGRAVSGLADGADVLAQLVDDVGELARVGHLEVARPRQLDVAPDEIRPGLLLMT